MVDNFEEEFQPLNLDPQFMSLRWIEEDLSVRELWARYLAKELVVSPDFQRNYVWDRIKASRFIESLLLNLPVPPIFLSEEKDESLEVIDGQQRLVSIFKFLQPLSGAANGRSVPGGLDPLTLIGLEVLSNLNGNNVTALSIPDRGKLWNTKLKTLKLPSDVHPDMKFELFIRLNLGSLNLNPQELRNCMFRGPYNDVITKLSKDHAFLELWGKARPDKRMLHGEYVLRFFAFLHSRDTYSVPQKSFLNNELRQNQSNANTGWEEEFMVGVNWVKRIFGNEAFKRFALGNADNPAGSWGPRRSAQLFELEMVSFAEMGERLDEIWESYDEEQRQLFRAAVRREFAGVMAEPKFVDAVTEGTTRPEQVRYRFDKSIAALSELVRSPDRSLDRTSEVLERLRQSTICTVCPSQMTIDDAAWKVTSEGRMLVHRYCAASHH